MLSRQAARPALPIVVALLLCVPPVAAADRPLPWQGGANEETGAEAQFGRAATEIAGRLVSVRCNGENDWQALAAQRGLSTTTWGYVSLKGGKPLDFTELSPEACWWLDVYAAASPKPAYWCTQVERRKTYVSRVVRVKAAKRVKRNGKWVTVAVWKTRRVSVPVTEDVQVKVKCPGADEWWKHVYALWTLAHESFHLQGITNEATADCYGMQEIARAAVSLGATPGEARSSAEYAATTLYAQKVAGSPAYGSPECRSGGALDRTPGDGVWP